jgi:hypothetical protein
VIAAKSQMPEEVCTSDFAGNLAVGPTVFDFDDVVGRDAAAVENRAEEFWRRPSGELVGHEFAVQTIDNSGAVRLSAEDIVRLRVLPDLGLFKKTIMLLLIDSHLVMGR